MKFKPIIIALMATVGLGQSQNVDSSMRPKFEVASINARPRPDPMIGKPPGGRLVARGILIKF